LPHDWQPTNAHSDREQVNKAREAAEALFRPTQLQVPTQAPLASTDVPPASGQHVPRQPRIFTIAPVSATGEKQREGDVTPKRKARRTPSTREAQTIMMPDHGRIRALAHYGMTPREVARLYGVSVKVIQSIVTDGLDNSSVNEERD
jgi:hypothetical protein